MTLLHIVAASIVFDGHTMFSMSRGFGRPALLISFAAAAVASRPLTPSHVTEPRSRGRKRHNIQCRQLDL